MSKLMSLEIRVNPASPRPQFETDRFEAICFYMFIHFFIMRFHIGGTERHTSFHGQ